MTIEILNQLEDKVSVLLSTLDRVREENTRLKQELEQSNGKIAEIEASNNSLKSELDSITLDSLDHKEKLNTAAEKIQGLLAKLETVEL